MLDFKTELLNKKLRKTEEPIRDFSNPKLAGFITNSEISNYQNDVLDLNIESWYDIIKDYTFPTVFCPIEQNDAQFFVDTFENVFKNNEQSTKADLNLILNSDQLVKLKQLESKLRKAFTEFNNQNVFVKTSSRSPKDSPMFSKKFAQLYKENVLKLQESARENENDQITCLLNAAFQCLKVTEPSEAIDMLIRSERIYQDMLLALKMSHRFKQNFIVRKFYEIEIDMEFRGFVFNGKLTALSQYNYLVHSQLLNENKSKICQLIEEFYNNEVGKKLTNEKYLSNFIIDFAVFSMSKVMVIELNPFLVTTDSALFSWEAERSILEGSNSELIFRITERPRKGSKAMLDSNMRSLISK